MLKNNYNVNAPLYTVQSISLQDELLETIYVFDCHQFPQFMRPLMNCTWNGRV